MNKEKTKTLYKLAKLQGIQIRYFNRLHDKDVDASKEAIIGGLRALGVEVRDDLSDVEAVFEKSLLNKWKSLSEPVCVQWEGERVAFPIRYEKKDSFREMDLQLSGKIVPEKGKSQSFSLKLSRFKVEKRIEIGGREFVERIVELPATLSKSLGFGYHRIALELGFGKKKKKQKLLVISSPLKSFLNAKLQGKSRLLGLFAPLYALHSKNSMGIGDFTDLEKFLEWTYDQGCDFVGTLPMLATFASRPIEEPSPYSPVSKLFWNELFIDPQKCEEWDECTQAQVLFESEPFQERFRNLESKSLVDYKKVAELKSSLLRILSEFFFSEEKEKSKEFRAFLKASPFVLDYARFRAVCDRRDEVWQDWPEHLRAGKICDSDFDKSDYEYHLFAQFAAHRQLEGLSQRGRERGLGIYLDLPLSVHKSGFDSWKESKVFGRNASAGCPPDPAHTMGQDWGILPLHPQKCREDGYRYVRECLKNQMRYSGLLRLDHVMHLYRLYWVPEGLTAQDGVYVLYDCDELFALLTLESHRNQCSLIGEDLGTVPPIIRRKMSRHGVFRYYIQQRHLKEDPLEPLAAQPKNCIASFGTHDMPPFAAFWKFLDLKDKMDLGYFDEEQLESKKADRRRLQGILKAYFLKKGWVRDSENLDEILKAFHFSTTAGPAKIVQVNLEDLWLEVFPQNVPATQAERPNWKRRLKHPMERFSDSKEVVSHIQELIEKRRAGPQKT